MGESSVFIQHSVQARDGDSEGLPVAIIEAMASALPIVSTFHGGIPEVVADGVTGLLVGEDDVAAMSDAMAALLDDPRRAAAMGAAGRQRVLGGYSQDYTLDELRSIMGLPRPALSRPAPRVLVQ
jgi:glycosyltransferase involved in cell wall biosynthesis